ncbi:MAG: insulinase family protein [Sedimentisphaerales bacterium]|nr:insulinase family protein [Sedimentisphaerales bacterium]
MEQRIDTCVLGDGMVLLGEPMAGVESVAFDIMLAAGAARMPPATCGAANVISDWIFRGAGSWDSRTLGDALDGLGLHRSSSIGSAHMYIGAALESSNLARALALYCEVVLHPHLGDEQFEPARQLVIEELRGLDDEPRQKVMIELRKRFYPDPLGRSTTGELADLQLLTAARARELARGYLNVPQVIFSVAGKYDLDAICRQIEGVFGSQQGEPLGPIVVGARGPRYTHIPHEGAQVHIGLMTPTARFVDEGYYDVRAAVSVLSGGMSSRLFTEVREKRGLCYAIGAKYHSLKEAAGISCYAGTTPDKAQETLDVILGEFDRLADGISEQELERAKVGLKSTLIMQSESSSSRAGAIAGDYYMLGRVRTLDEIKGRIEASTVDSVLGFLRSHPFRDFTVVTVGPREVRFG